RDTADNHLSSRISPAQPDRQVESVGRSLLRRENHAGIAKRRERHNLDGCGLEQRRSEMVRRFSTLTAVLALLLLSGCGYNTLQQQDEQTKAAWAEVLNQYQRRADLVPQLVEVVKGYATQERDVLL